MKRYETYELFEYTALLAAIAELLTAAKLSGFAPVRPFALLPVTACAGAAVRLHRKLPKDRKCSFLSRSHPAYVFAVLSIGNAALFLELILKHWRR